MKDKIAELLADLNETEVLDLVDKAIADAMEAVKLADQWAGV